MPSLKLFAAAAAVATFAVSSANAATIFADFNVTAGTFNRQPNFSGSSTNTSATSTAGRVTTDAFEGAGSLALSVVPTTAGSSQRTRFVSGDGSPANNSAFTVPASGAPNIGFYYKTSVAGITAQIYLDRPANTVATGIGTIATELIADGTYHLYEYNLLDSTKFGAIPGLAGGPAPAAGDTFTIDSIVFQNSAGVSYTGNLDFVAYNEAGSIAALVPEPTSIAALGLVSLAFARRRRA
jgi:hypothetical protein